MYNIQAGAASTICSCSSLPLPFMSIEADGSELSGAYVLSFMGNLSTHV